MTDAPPIDPIDWRNAIETAHDFMSTKLALLCGGDVLIYRRDNTAAIPYPNAWDLPGGGREGNETPFECGARELKEEFDLPLRHGALRWATPYRSPSHPGARSWFIVAALSPGDVGAIRFGSEGQEWRMVPCAEFLREAEAVPYLKARLADYIAAEHPGLVG